MKAADRVRQIIPLLQKEFPNAKCALYHENAFQLLVATILSAQCTDKKVNEVTPDLFKKYSRPEDFAKAPATDIEKAIKKIGLFRSKAKNIKLMAEKLCKDFDSQVPDNLEDLIQLAGVGRKTANVVLGEIFGKSEGVVVDTHVRRISQLLGLTKNDHPEKIEKDLMKIVPKENWVIFAHLLILHGRRTCIARRPHCEDCVLHELCPHGIKLLKLKRKKAASTFS